MASKDLHNFWDNYMETMNMMVGIIMLLAIVLAWAVVCNGLQHNAWLYAGRNA